MVQTALILHDAPADLDRAVAPPGKARELREIRVDTITALNALNAAIGTQRAARVFRDYKACANADVGKRLIDANVLVSARMLLHGPPLRDSRDKMV